ncbi:MAG: ABC transporter substrate-binding protein, partial [Acidimicrobiales bacterium]
PSLGVRAPGTVAGPGDDPARTPTGTGPFRFVSYSRGAQLRVEPFAEYWGDQALLRSLTFRFGAERDASRLLATRQVELVGQIPYGSIANVSGRTDRLVTSRPGRSLYLLLNIGGVDEWATLKDENLRRAVALALDRTALTKSAFGELAEPSRTLVLEPALGPSAERVRAPGTDERTAARLLEDAGWRRATDGVRTRDGQPLVLRLILSQPAEQAEVGALIRAQLAQVGVGVEIVDPAPDTPFVRINQSTFHLYLDVRAQDDANPCNLCRFFTIRPGGSLPFAGSVGAGQDGDNLFELLHSTGPIDGARRLAADLMNIVTTERILAIPLAGLRSAWVVSPRVRGFDPAPLGGDQRWDAVWLAA